ncbi:MAG TPA: hypothetical protein VFR18_27870 [Terriglobia bacterium]|nr:hypothetical protein [Terriglobia bacterium]
MARIVLVVICGVLVFVFVSRFAPHFLETIGTANPEATAAAEEEANSKTKAKAKSSAPKSKASATARTASKAAPASTTPVADELPATLTPEATPETPAPATNSRHVVKVAAEDATLYRTNTTGGPVVARLSKGAVVEPVFVVSTAGQNWTFVTAGDEELAGFIRTETLSRNKSTETARR